jgi:hypothetical protein
MACTGSAGYQGFLTTCGKVLPFLSADITRVQELYPSNAIHGGGSGNTNPIFRSMHNYALGRITAEGNVTTEVFGGTGNYAAAFLEILKRAVPTQTDDSDICNGFDNSCKLIFSPGGGSEIILPDPTAGQPKAVVASLGLRGNPGGNVQATFRITSTGADFNQTAANTPTVANLAFEPGGLTDDNNPIPYYASSFSVTGSGESNLAERITDWNIDINNNPFYIWTFNGEAQAQDLVLGMLSVTGTFQYYSATGEFVETLTHGAVCTVTFGSITLTIPHLGFGASPLPSPGPSAATVRTVNFTGFATSSGPSIYRS